LLQKANIPIPKHSHRSSGRHRKGDEKSLFTFTIFRNVSWLYLFIFFFKKKEFCISPGLGEQIGVGKRERGGYEPSPVVVPGPPISSFPFARPGKVR